MLYTYNHGPTVWVIQTFYDDHMTQDDSDNTNDPIKHVTICRNVEDIRDRIADELNELWLDPENPNDYPDIMNDMDYFTVDRLNSMPTVDHTIQPKYELVYSYSGLVTVVVYRAYLSS